VIDKPFCRSLWGFFDRQRILPLKSFRQKGCFLRCEIRRFYENLFGLLFGTGRAANPVPKKQYKTFKNLL
tara:strand:+ start:347 stop:556 length:210 start_codon:yes stop_codon:yes gene_type:complete